MPIFSQVDLSKCNNVTVFLAPSVVSKIMKKALIKFTNLIKLKEGSIGMIRQCCIYNTYINIFVFKGSNSLVVGVNIASKLLADVTFYLCVFVILAIVTATEVAG